MTWKTRYIRTIETTLLKVGIILRGETECAAAVHGITDPTKHEFVYLFKSYSNQSYGQLLLEVVTLIGVPTINFLRKLPK